LLTAATVRALEALLVGSVAATDAAVAAGQVAAVVHVAGPPGRFNRVTLAGVLGDAALAGVARRRHTARILDAHAARRGRSAVLRTLGLVTATAALALRHAVLAARATIGRAAAGG